MSYYRGMMLACFTGYWSPVERENLLPLTRFWILYRIFALTLRSRDFNSSTIVDEVHNNLRLEENFPLCGRLIKFCGG